MRIFHAFSGLPPDARGAAVALGNFDGVHRGHAALTFEPHPREVFRPSDPPFRLTLAEAKAEALAALGVELLYELRFDLAFSRMPAEAFIDTVLAEGLGARHLACGPDFHFGHKRTGTAALLATLGPAHGMGVSIVPEAAAPDGLTWSSTAVRDALKAGDCARAAAILGRAWEIRGRVVRGSALGRTLGFPTANIPLGRHLAPRFGIYAVEAGLVDAAGQVAWHPGVASLGLRPTVNPLPEPLLEVHLFDLAADLYGAAMRVRLHAFLRDEARFETLDALVAQMHQDATQARALLASGLSGRGCGARL